MDLTPSKLAAYAVGAFLVVLGARLASISPFGGVLLVVAGLFSWPITRWRLRTRFGLNVSRRLAVALIVSWVVVGLGLVVVATVG